MRTSYRIVVGVDGSEGGRRALRWAVHEAAARGGTVQAVHAWRWDTADLPSEVTTYPRPAHGDTTTVSSDLPGLDTAGPNTRGPETAYPDTAAPETGYPDTAAPVTAAPETAYPSRQRDRAEQTLQWEVESTGDPAGVTIAGEVSEGRAADVLTAAARDADLLVLGSHGHSQAWHTVLGSVSEECIRKASCPVVVLPVPRRVGPDHAQPPRSA